MLLVQSEIPDSTANTIRILYFLCSYIIGLSFYLRLNNISSIALFYEWNTPYLSSPTQSGL